MKILLSGAGAAWSRPLLPTAGAGVGSADLERPEPERPIKTIFF